MHMLLNLEEMTKQAEKAIIYLSESEADYASLRSAKETEDERLKILLASLKLESGESSDNKAETWARGSQEYKQAVEDKTRLLDDYYLIFAKRARAESTIEVWRSVNSSYNRGNPT